MKDALGRTVPKHRTIEPIKKTKRRTVATGNKRAKMRVSKPYMGKKG